LQVGSLKPVDQDWDGALAEFNQTGGCRQPHPRIIVIKGFGRPLRIAGDAPIRPSA